MDLGDGISVSQQSTGPPISKLHRDILACIFGINADMDHDEREKEIWETRALNVLRYSSQVCHHWREIILSSPSLWGKVMDLELPQQEKVLWREEVLRRTGQARLYVKGTVDAYIEASREFFSSLLTDHWSRIRKLDVVIIGHLMFLLDGTCTAFQRPAPQLESFMVYVGDWDASDSSNGFMADYPKALFSDDAPLLHEFMFPPTRREIVRFEAPWLSQLRFLSLFQDFTAAEVLGALEHMPSLRSLELHECVKWSTLPHKEPISLPALSNILIYSALLPLLEHIIPSSTCSLTIRTTDMTDEEIEAIQRVITHFSQFWFDLKVLKAFTIKCRFKILTFGSPPAEDGFSSFWIVIRTQNYIPPPAVPAILGSFPPSVFHNTSLLEFILTGGLPFRDPAKSAMAAFLSVFSSVDVLQASEDTIKFLDTPTGHPLLFPSLKTLKFRLTGREVSPDPIVDLLTRFACWRVIAGVPITKVEVVK